MSIVLLRAATVCLLAGCAFADYDPSNVLPDGRPAQYAFTQGTLNWLAIRANFPNNAHPLIPIEGSLTDSVLDTALFFSDSSWGKLSINFTFPPIADLTTTAESSTADTIKTESLAAMSKLNYSYCGWPCGTPKAKAGGYDGVLAAFYPNAPVVNWAGLGVLGNGFTWTIYPTSAGILEHEIGHNFGMSHGLTAKSRAGGVPYNTPDYEGFSRMAGGGTVYRNDPTSRFKNNGHFDPSSKHWFGWIEDSQVVFLSRGGPSVTCLDCVSSWSGKLNAYDRPDVVPGRTMASSGSPYFAARLAYSPNNLVYIYYRTSYAETRSGVSVQFCTRNYASYLNAGMSSTCYTYDVGGDTASMADSTVVPGTSYVAAPTFAANERLSVSALKNILPVITVKSVANFSDCPNMVCPQGKDISAELSVRFMTDAEIASAPQPVLAVAPSSSTSYNVTLAAGQALVMASDFVTGAKGQATWTFSLCLPGATKEATVYVYDSYPYSPLLFGSPLGYQAINAFRFFSVDCCRPGDVLDAPGVRVVVVRQLDQQPLHIAEIEVYSKQNPTVNVGRSAKCWSLPTGGSYYNGDSSGRQAYANDGLYTTYSHSGGVDALSGFNHIDMCVFDDPVDVARVKVYPRSDWPSRSKNLRVELYALVGSDANPSGLRPVGLLWNASISMKSSSWFADLAVPSNLPKTLTCDGSMARSQSTTVPVVQGTAYALIKARGAADATMTLTSSLSSTSCPDSAYLSSHWQGQDIKGCRPCPAIALSYAGEMSSCAASVAAQTCSALILSGSNLQTGSAASAYFGLARTASDGIATYTATDNASVAWSYSAAAWEVRDRAGGLQASRASLEVGSFTGSPDWSQLSATGGRGGIQAVAIQMNIEEILNLCELEILDAGGNNLARSAQCYNLPPSTNYYYTGDRATGKDPRLNDGCTGNQNYCSCAHGTTTAPRYLVSMMACVFNASYPVKDIKIYINDVWSSRSRNVNILLFDSVPAGPITLASFAKPVVRRTGVDLRVASNRRMTLCYSDVVPPPPATAGLANVTNG